MTPTLTDAARALLARIRKERGRPASTTPTHEIGGIARVSADLEGLLRLVLEAVAIERGTSADDMLRGALHRTVRLARATGGDLVSALLAVAREPAAQGPGVSFLIEELRKPDNRIWRTLQRRNDVLHGRAEPVAARAAVRDLEGFVLEYLASTERG